MAGLKQPRPAWKQSSWQSLVQHASHHKSSGYSSVYPTVLLSVWPKLSRHGKTWHACKSPGQRGSANLPGPRVPHLHRIKTNWARGQIYSWVEQQATSGLRPNTARARRNQSPEFSESNRKVHNINETYPLSATKIYHAGYHLHTLIRDASVQPASHSQVA